jgi:hypothetical protein
LVEKLKRSCEKNRGLGRFSLPSEKIVSLAVHPVFPGDVSLPENSDKKIHADFGTMRVRDSKNKIAADHIRVFPAMKRTVETKYF